MRSKNGMDTKRSILYRDKRILFNSSLFVMNTGRFDDVVVFLSSSESLPDDRLLLERLPERLLSLPESLPESSE